MQISDIICNSFNANSTTKFMEIDDYFNIALAQDVITQEFELYCTDNEKLVLIRTFKNERIAREAWGFLYTMDGSGQS